MLLPLTVHAVLAGSNHPGSRWLEWMGSSPLSVPQRQPWVHGLGQTQWRSTLTSLSAQYPALPPVLQRVGQGHHCLTLTQLDSAQTTFRTATQVLFRPLRRATAKAKHSLVNIFQHFMHFLECPHVHHL